MKNLLIIILFILFIPYRISAQEVKLTQIHVPTITVESYYEKIHFNSIEVSSQNSVLYALTDYYLMKSFDRGVTWIPTEPSLEDKYQQKLITGKENEVILGYTFKGDFYIDYSDDYGTSWKNLKIFQYPNYVGNIIQLEDGNLLVASSQGLIKLFLNGKINQRILPKEVLRIYDVGEFNNSVIFTSNKGVFKTDINLSSYEKLNFSEENLFDIISSKQNQIFLFTSISKQVFRLTPTFDLVELSLPIENPQRIEVKGNNIILYDDFIYVSVDQGENWIKSKDSFSESNYEKLVDDVIFTCSENLVQYQNFFRADKKNSEIYVSQDYCHFSPPVKFDGKLIINSITLPGSMSQSNNGGLTWEKIGGNGLFLETDPDLGRIYSFPSFGYTDDFGKTWVHFSSDDRAIQGAVFLVVKPSNNKVYFYDGDHRRFRKVENEFNSFPLIDLGLEDDEIVMPKVNSNGQVLALATSGKLFIERSDLSWDLLYNFGEEVYSLETDQYDNIIVGSLRNNRFFFSKDGGKSFSVHIVGNDELYGIYDAISDGFGNVYVSLRQFNIYSNKVLIYRYSLKENRSYKIQHFEIYDNFLWPDLIEISLSYSKLSIVDDYLYLGCLKGLFRSNQKISRFYNTDWNTSYSANKKPSKNIANNNSLSVYPNPSNSQTTIQYSLIDAASVSVSILNILGQRVAEIVNEYQSKGNYKYDFQHDDLSSGIYLLALQIDHQIFTKKMIILK